MPRKFLAAVGWWLGPKQKQKRNCHIHTYTKSIKPCGCPVARYRTTHRPLCCGDVGSFTAKFGELPKRSLMTRQPATASRGSLRLFKIIGAHVRPCEGLQSDYTGPIKELHKAT